MAILRSVTRAHQRVGQTLSGRYRLVAPIGTGASASVYLAEDLNLRRNVAVKVLHDALADDEAFLRRFQREARAAAALSHPHITAVYDWSDAEVPYLVMEFLPGGNLRMLLDRAGTLSLSQALLVGLEAARGLDFAHRRGVVHRDIKPANLLFDDEGRLRIADFGLARALAEAAFTEPSGGVVGTAKYASPEQALGEPLRGSSDVYSLALVVIESITGQVPFASDTSVGTLLARVGHRVPVPEEAGPLQPVLEWAATTDPAGRPDAAAFGSALLEVARELSRPAPLPLVRTAELFDEADLDPEVQGAMALALADPPIVVPDDSSLTSAEGRADAPPRDLTTIALDPAKPLASEHTVVEEPAARPAQRWGRHHPDLVEQETGPVDAVDAAVGDRPAMPYDFEAESSDDFDDGTGGARTPRRRSRRPRPTARRWTRRTLRVLLVLVVAVAALVLLVGGGTLPGQIQPIASTVVPDLSTADVATLDQLARDNGWVVVPTSERVDGTVPFQILGQQPAAGEALERGGVLRLRISAGPTLVPVPNDLVGLSLADADAKLRAAELSVGEVQRQPSEDVDADIVLGLAPGLEASLPKGAAVPLVVSAGPAPRIVPFTVAGQKVTDARRQLEALGLEVSTRSGFSDSVPRGSVISTVPGPGQQVERGGTVSLTVSSGPEPSTTTTTAEPDQKDPPSSTTTTTKKKSDRN